MTTPCIVDATLRDGGYLNNWDFSIAQMMGVTEALDSIGIDIIEVGYLNDSPGLSIGYSCPVDLLTELRKRVKVSRLAGMLAPRNENAPEILKSRRDLIELVRIPLDLTSFEAGLKVAEHAKTFGIKSSLNFISITALGENELINAVRTAVSRDVADCIYLADSRGTITPSELTYLIEQIRIFWDGPLGFHGHDNIGFALENTMAAISAGCTMVDGTVGGVGLGGGNTRLDELIDRVASMRMFPGKSKEVIQSVSALLSLVEPAGIMHLYKLSGEKNLEQEWVPIIQERFKENAASYMEKIPWKRYKDLEEILY